MRTKPYKEVAAEFRRVIELKSKLEAEAEISYHLLTWRAGHEIDLDTGERVGKGARFRLDAVVTLDCDRPTMSIQFYSDQPRRDIENWDELTAEQLTKVVELRRELEKWEAGEIDCLPDPATWNGGTAWRDV